MQVSSIPSSLFPQQRLSQILAKCTPPSLGLIVAGLMLATCLPVKAQTPLTPLSTDAETVTSEAGTPGTTVPETVTDIPVEVPVEESQLTPLTDTPTEATIQVPNIVPIPPRPTPIGPFSPLPDASSREVVRPEDTYLLGPGDQIVIDIFDVPEFSGDAGTYTLLIDGTVILPWIGQIRLQGLTLSEAATLLEREYGSRGYIREPVISVNLTAPRDLTISVVGQVKRPGAYAITPTGTTATPALVGAGAGGGAEGGGNQWPTVTQALQSAQGTTQLADLRNVQVRRPLRDGSEQLINVNLWELIRSGQLNQDITLRDGDTIIVPTAVALSPDEAILTGSANFAPATIRINVVGQVVAPGVVEVPPNTSLNQAIQAAGGFDVQRARRSRVQLVRLNPNGTAVKRTVEIDLAAGINEENNPALQDGDTIVVSRSGLTSFSDTLETVLDPVDSFFDFLDIFGIFDD